VEVNILFNNCICPVETTLDLIGGKYKALILWHLFDGKLRFSELRKTISSATPKMLTQQLRELEAQNLVHREVFPVIPPRVEYSLTALGKSLMPVLLSMRDWGVEYLHTKNLKPTCSMMENSLKTNNNNEDKSPHKNNKCHAYAKSCQSQTCRHHIFH
jgi:DNA-binding HxlR family transcriptional regulator